MEIMHDKRSMNMKITVLGLITNALISITYRFYKWLQMGNLEDLIGQTGLGIIILVIACFCWKGRPWALVGTLIYGIFFLIVTPLYTINILLPSNPGIIDHAENVVYTIILVIVIIFSYKSLKETKREM